MLEALLAKLNTEEDRSRFRVLYETYVRLMFHIANQYLPDPRDAEEAVSEAFFRISEHFSEIGEIDCPKTRNLVVIITRNIAKDLLRKQKRQVPTVDLLAYVDEEGEAAPWEETMSDDWQGVEALFATLTLEDAMAEIRALPQAVRDAMLLCVGEEYTVAEAAEILGITESTLRKRLQRGRQMLREKLRETNDRELV